MAKVDIRPFVLGWLKDVRGATAPDGGWRTLDEIRAGLQRQGIQASAPECRKVLQALTDEDSLARRLSRPDGTKLAWRFMSEEENTMRIEGDAAVRFSRGRGDVFRTARTTHGRVEVTLDFLDELCRRQGFREEIASEIHKARASARGLIQAPDAPKDGGERFIYATGRACSLPGPCSGHVHANIPPE